MKLKSDSIEIPEIDKIKYERDIFKNDKLNRKEEIEILTEFVRNVETPFVMTLNSQWGNGKTTFIRLWKRYLEYRNVPSIFFNAWETEFLDMPLFSLIGELKGLISENENWKDKAKKIYEKSNKIGLILKNLPYLNLSSEDWKDAFDITLQKYSEFKSKIEKFKANFNKRIKKLRQNYIINEYKPIKHLNIKLPKGLNSIFKKKNINSLLLNENINLFAIDFSKNLIFFIDELDRCKPKYVIEMLEIVKHFFDLDNVVFILSIDINQINNSLESVYSSSIEAKQFLNKIVDLSYDLSKKDNKVYLENLLSEFDIEDQFGTIKIYNTNIYIDKILKIIFDKWNYSLRQQEVFIRRVVLLLKLKNQIGNIDLIFAIFLILIKREGLKDKGDNKIYSKILSKNYQSKKLIDSFIEKNKPLPNFITKNFLGAVEGFLVLYKNDESDYTKYKLSETNPRYEEGEKNRFYFAASIIKDRKEINIKDITRTIKAISITTNTQFNVEENL